MSRRYVPTGQPRHKQAPGPKPETLALIARVREALAAGVYGRPELAARLDETPGRIAMAMDYIGRWDGAPPMRRGHLLQPQSREWMERAACKGRDVSEFFGFEGERQPARQRRERKAEQVCAGCPVRTDCFEWAIGRPEKFGTWGGMDEDTRAKERAKRMRAASEPAREAS